jgi:hypothetical protein
VTIACLTVYVDGSFYDSWLHRKGGVVFAAFALMILVPSLLALKKAESYSQREHPTLTTKEVGGAQFPADCLIQRNEVA